MENQDFSLDHSVSEIETLTLPHFDDEVTIQSARPVVPLHEVRKASQRKQRLLLAGALCVAAVMGGLTAAWVTGPSPVQESTTAKETSPLPADFVTPSSEASGATVDPNEAVALDSEATTEGPDDLRIESGKGTARPQTQNTRSEKKVENVVQPSPVQPAPIPAPQVRESDDERIFTDEEFRRERRREARRLRRERRVEEQRADDGLTRIREIFEGSPRP